MKKTSATISLCLRYAARPASAEALSADSPGVPGAPPVPRGADPGKDVELLLHPGRARSAGHPPDRELDLAYGRAGQGTLTSTKDLRTGRRGTPPAGKTYSLSLVCPVPAPPPLPPPHPHVTPSP